jgi:hypothetical protein
VTTRVLGCGVRAARCVVVTVVVGAVGGRATTVDGTVFRWEFAFPDRFAFEPALRRCARAWCLRRCARRAAVGAAAAVRADGLAVAAAQGFAGAPLWLAIDVPKRPEPRLTANAMSATATSPSTPATSQLPVGPSQVWTRLTIRLSVSVTATIAVTMVGLPVQRPGRAFVKPM